MARRSTPPLFELLQSEPKPAQGRDASGSKAEPAGITPGITSGITSGAGTGSSQAAVATPPKREAPTKPETRIEPKPASKPVPTTRIPEVEAQSKTLPRSETSTLKPANAPTKPAPAPVKDAGEPKTHRIGGAVFEDGHFSAPVSYLYLALAGLILLTVVAWSSAFALGGSAKEQELGQLIGQSTVPETEATPTINEPLNREDVTAPQPDPGPPIDRSLTQEQVAALPEAAREQIAGRDPGAAIPATAVLTSAGAAVTDPRQSGLNYLVLVGSRHALEQDEALALVDFMVAGGIEVYAVPVDSGARGANNPPRYLMVAATGVPGSEFSSRRAERQKLQSDAQSLGRRWQEQMGGSTRFEKPLWMKYQP